METVVLIIFFTWRKMSPKVSKCLRNVAVFRSFLHELYVCTKPPVESLLWAILARWSRFTQLILLTGVGVLKTTMMLTGRPLLGDMKHVSRDILAECCSTLELLHPDTHLSGFPGTDRRRQHLLAFCISSSFRRMNRCRARHQSWDTVVFRFWDTEGRIRDKGFLLP